MIEAVHLALVVFEDAKISELVGECFGVFVAIVAADADENA